jgi:hypothetical protein
VLALLATEAAEGSSIAEGGPYVRPAAVVEEAEMEGE